MKKKLTIAVVGLSTMTAIWLYSAPSYSDDNVADLKKQVEALQKRVEQLEAEQVPPAGDDARDFFNSRRQRRWDPFAEIDRMQEEMDRMFQDSFNNRGWKGGGTFSNQLSFENEFDLKETKDGYEIRFDMTGLDKDKVDIQINEHSITVKGEHSRQDMQEGQNSYFRAQTYGSFMRTIPLPLDADTAKLKTEKEGDSLVIKLPKKNS